MLDTFRGLSFLALCMVVLAVLSVLFRREHRRLATRSERFAHLVGGAIGIAIGLGAVIILQFLL